MSASIKILNAKARSPLPHAPDDEFGRYSNEEPGLRFVVAGSAGPSAFTDSRMWFDRFTDAVDAARTTIERIDYGLGTSGDPRSLIEDGHIIHYTRAFVDLRQSSTYAAGTEIGSGTDEVLMRWEVFHDRVVLGNADGDALRTTMARPAPKVGWA